MSWVTTYAYRDPEFVLEQLLKQVRIDIKEANALPEKAREGCAFELKERNLSSATLELTTPLGPYDAINFAVLMGTDIVRAIREERRSRSTTYDLRARWDEEMETTLWTVTRNGEMESGLTVSDVTRMILEPVMFPTAFSEDKSDDSE